MDSSPALEIASGRKAARRSSRCLWAAAST